MQETPVHFLGQEDPWRRDRLPTPVFLGFPCGSDSRESAYNSGDPSLIPGLGASPGEGHGNPLQCSYVQNSADRGACGLQSTGPQRAGHSWAPQCGAGVFLDWLLPLRNMHLKFPCVLSWLNGSFHFITE